MAKRKKPVATKTAAEKPASSGETTNLASAFAAYDPSESKVYTGNLSLHDMYQNQVRETLDQSDLDEDSKQAILVAMSCPCCGSGSMNYTAKLNRRR